MKIVNKKLEKTSNVSSAQGSSVKEFGELILYALILLVSVYFLIVFIVDFAVANISFETEAKIFKFLKLSDSDQSSNQKLIKATAILKILKASQQVAPLPYNLVLIKDETPNAFAFPGGTIGITTALLDALNDEIEIAFVIGHELGHFANRDHLHGIGRTLGFNIIIAMLFGSSDSLGSLINFIIQRNYSQDRERQADRFGLALVYSIYNSTATMEHLFKLLEQHSKLPGWAYMFTTHPAPEERIKALEKYGRELALK